MIKKFSARYASVRFIELISLSFDLIEGHWECEKHAVMLGCLGKELLRVEGATHLQNGESKISVVIKFFCKKGMPPRNFIRTSWKPLEGVSL